MAEKEPTEGLGFPEGGLEDGPQGNATVTQRCNDPSMGSAAQGVTRRPSYTPPPTQQSLEALRQILPWTDPFFPAVNV